MINPAERPYVRGSGVLKKKFAEFKSLYGTCVARFEASGQGDPDAFASFADVKMYIMYGYCFSQLHTLLKPFVTRALTSDAQKEEEVGSGISAYGYGGHAVRRSLQRHEKRHLHDMNVIGMSNLVSAWRPQPRLTSADLESVKRRTMHCEMLDA